MSTIITFVIGLFGLGILVFIHESGHFFACKLVGIEVEAFALGWGKPILRKKWRGTEYRISMFPIGGYCKMKGEELFRKAVEEKATTIEKEEGSMFAASAPRLIFTYLAGPLANLITAILMFSIIWFAGFNVQSSPARIVLASKFDPNIVMAADQAGLKTGDIILRIGKKDIRNFEEMRQAVSQSWDHASEYLINRDGEIMTLTVTPALNKDEARGQLGVWDWQEPYIANVKKGSPAEEAGLKSGDLITAIDGRKVKTTIEIAHLYSPEEKEVRISYIRDNFEYSTVMNLVHDTQKGFYTGIEYQYVDYLYQEKNVFRAIGAGTRQSFETLGTAIKSIPLLFKGINLKKAGPASPVRIAYIIGENSRAEFKVGFGNGLSYFVRLLGLISIILFFSNLLPIPALDGGMILFNTVHMVTRKPINPRVFYRYNLFGFFIIIGIIVLAVINDFSFFTSLNK